MQIYTIVPQTTRGNNSKRANDQIISEKHVSAGIFT